MNEIHRINEKCKRNLKTLFIGVIIADLIVLIASFYIVFL